MSFARHTSTILLHLCRFCQHDSIFRVFLKCIRVLRLLFFICLYQLHVHDSLSLDGFVPTISRNPSDPVCPGVFSLDCEMVKPVSLIGRIIFVLNTRNILHYNSLDIICFLSRSIAPQTYYFSSPTFCPLVFLISYTTGINMEFK